MVNYTLTFTTEEEQLLMTIFNTTALEVEGTLQSHIDKIIDKELNNQLDEEFKSKTTAEKKTLLTP